jgi:hypothetical protein
MARSEHPPVNEELRALLVLGVIGSLLAARGALVIIKVGAGFSLGDIANFLIFYWGTYLFLVAIGISNDVIYPPIAGMIKAVAKRFFFVGIPVTIGMSFVLSCGFLSPSFVSTNLGLVFTGGAAIVVCLIAIILLFPKAHEQRKRVAR